MERDQLPWLTVAEAARLIEGKAISPVELTRAVLDRIEKAESKVNAYITVLRERALEEAAQAERELGRGARRGPLHGIPLAVKDLFYTRDARTTCGSKVLADWTPDYDATCVVKLREAGAVLVGKTNLHEFAAGSTTNNPHFGPTHNPWDLEHIPGGSSGGSGAAVAAGLALAALGTDTGGSVRSPCSQCSLVGLKPTYGLVSRYGVFPLSWSLDHVGPMARTAEDCALLLQALAGHDSQDSSSADLTVPNYGAALAGGVRGLRVGVLGEYLEQADQEVADLVTRAVGVLEELGAHTEAVALPQAREYAAAAGNTISWSEAASIHEEWLRSRPQDYGEDVRARFRLGAMLLAGHYHRAQRLRTLVQREMSGVMQRFDVLVSPTNPIPSPRIGEQVVKLRGREYPIFGPKATMPRFTRLFNLTGQPTASVPCGFTADGLPVGMQVAGRLFEDAMVLRVAHAYQGATSWHTRRPPI
ncbi:MAG: Asp-tRNA(Asn)/Glu-tRNA(Gln) amidotransferase subunit GatA [Chloroflexi bacterium]|nr:Asp-tRNA(Asn)/Glu-tRNA(Gln) amidotransferase subunit GatA [Chloroflexota bacterium]